MLSVLPLEMQEQGDEWFVQGRGVGISAKL